MASRNSFGRSGKRSKLRACSHTAEEFSLLLAMDLKHFRNFVATEISLLNLLSRRLRVLLGGPTVTAWPAMLGEEDLSFVVTLLIDRRFGGWR